MKLRYRLGVFSLVIPIVLGGCIVAAGTLVIDDILYRLNRKLLIREIAELNRAIDAKYNALLRAGVENLPHYVDRAQKELLAMVESDHFELTGKAFILATNGDPVYEPRFGEEANGEFQFPPPLLEKKGPEANFKDLHYFSVYRLNDSFNWIIGQAIEKNKMHAERNRYLTTVTAITSLFLFASLIWSYRFQSAIARDVEVMRTGVALVSRGDFSTRLAEHMSSAELTELGSGINAMIAGLQSMTQNLRASEERYRSVVEDLTEFVFRWAPDGRIVYANDAYCAYKQSPKTQVVGRNIRDLFSGAAFTQTQEAIARLRPDSPTVTSDHCTTGPDGQTIWEEWIDRGIFDGSGNLIEIQSVGRNVTERKRAELALKDSEERYRAFIANSPDAIYRFEIRPPMPVDLALEEQVAWLLDHAVLTECNDKYARLIGAESAERAIGINLGFLPGQDMAETRSLLRDYIRSGYRLAHYESYYLGADAQKYWAVITGFGIIENNYLTRHWGVEEDVTERKAAEAALAKSRVFNDNLIQTANVLIIGLDLHGGITVFNPMAAEVTGYSAEELAGKNWFEVIVPQERYPEVWGEFERLMQDGRPKPFENPILTKGGEERIISWSNNEITDNGRIVGTLSFGIDITERKQAEEALRRSERALRSLSLRLQEVEELSRKGLARELHDRVGQSLTALNINLQIIQSQISETSALGVVGRLKDSMDLVEETTCTIRDVMAELRPSVLDDYGLFAALRWYGERFANRTGVAVQFHGEHDTQRMSEEVESAFFRIAQEALTNIAKHARAEEVHMTLAQRQDHYRLSIADDGQGFDLEAQRTGGLRSWGLLNMRERAQALGGQVRIESIPGQGTTVTAELKG